MSLRELLTAKDDRETAQGPLRDAIDVGIELIQNSRNEEKQLRKEAVQGGLDMLECTLRRYRTNHSEVRNQLTLRAQKEKGGEDKEVAILQVLREDTDSNNIRPFLQEADKTIDKLNIILKNHQREKVAAEEKEVADLEQKLKLDRLQLELDENNRKREKEKNDNYEEAQKLRSRDESDKEHNIAKREAEVEVAKKLAEARMKEEVKGEAERQKRQTENLEEMHQLKVEKVKLDLESEKERIVAERIQENNKKEAEEIRLKEDERRRQEKHEDEMKNVDQNAETQRRLWEQNPQILQPAISTAVVQAPDRLSAGTSMQSQNQELFKIMNEQLPKFDGDLSKAAEFILYFEELIHKRTDLSDAAKFAILYSHLVDGSIAKRCLEGFHPVDADYGPAWRKLKDRFYDPERVIQDRLHRLSQAKPKSASIKDLREYQVELESGLRVLESHQVLISQDVIFLQSVKQKLPLSVFRHIEYIRVEKNVAWSLSFLIEELNRYIKLEEAFPSFEQKSDEKKKELRPSGYPWKMIEEYSPEISRSSAQTLAATLEGNSDMKVIKCVYCGESHYPDQCKTFPTYDKRMEVLKKAGRCFLCLETKHLAKDCPESTLNYGI